MPDVQLPPFDPKAKCIKCGWSIPDPVAPPAKPPTIGADGKAKPQAPPAPPPPPEPPHVEYCDGQDCPWDEEDDEPGDNHLHQFCQTCGFEWLARPLDAT